MNQDVFFKEARRQESLRLAAEFQAMDRAMREKTTVLVYYLPGWPKAWVRSEAEGRDGIPAEARVCLQYHGGAR